MVFVDCPKCRGSGSYCSTCEGEGRVVSESVIQVFKDGSNRNPVEMTNEQIRMGLEAVLSDPSFLVVRREDAPRGTLIQSEWKYGNRIWTLAMDSDIDAPLEERFALVDLDRIAEEDFFEAHTD